MNSNNCTCHSCSTLSKILDQLKLVQAAVDNSQSEPSDKWMSLDDLVQYLPNNPSKATIYNKTRNKTIPFHKNPGSKFLVFRKSEIDHWLTKSKVPTLSELEKQVDYKLSNL